MYFKLSGTYTNAPMFDHTCVACFCFLFYVFVFTKPSNDKLQQDPRISQGSAKTRKVKQDLKDHVVNRSTNMYLQIAKEARETKMQKSSPKASR